MIDKWKRKLSLKDWDITTEEISDAQVTYPDDCVGEERFFVGIEIGDGKAKIYHARELTEEDIVHELLHVKHPEKSEDWVEQETERLING